MITSHDQIALTCIFVIFRVLRPSRIARIFTLPLRGIQRDFHSAPVGDPACSLWRLHGREISLTTPSIPSMYLSYMFLIWQRSRGRPQRSRTPFGTLSPTGRSKWACGRWTQQLFCGFPPPVHLEQNLSLNLSYSYYIYILQSSANYRTSQGTAHPSRTPRTPVCLDNIFIWCAKYPRMSHLWSKIWHKTQWCENFLTLKNRCKTSTTINIQVFPKISKCPWMWTRHPELRLREAAH